MHPEVFSLQQRLFSPWHDIAYVFPPLHRTVYLHAYFWFSCSLIPECFSHISILQRSYFNPNHTLKYQLKTPFYKAFLADSATETTSPSSQLIQTQVLGLALALTAVILILCTLISSTRSGAPWRGKPLESGRPGMRGSWEGLCNPSKLQFFS